MICLEAWKSLTFKTILVLSPALTHLLYRHCQKSELDSCKTKTGNKLLMTNNRLSLPGIQRRSKQIWRGWLNYMQVMFSRTLWMILSARNVEPLQLKDALIVKWRGIAHAIANSANGKHTNLSATCSKKHRRALLKTKEPKQQRLSLNPLRKGRWFKSWIEFIDKKRLLTV